MEIKDLYERTINWAEEHQINNIHTQALKTCEEWNEVISELNHGRFGDEFEDGLGDSIISFVIFAHIAGKDLKECWAKALDIVEKRTGTTQNGNFIKDEVCYNKSSS